ncbi:Uncharacterized protein ACO02O_03602 [Dirofilaria immitis]
MKCLSRNIIYVRTEGYYLSERIQAEFQDLTLSECADQCTFKIQGVNCTSFEYDAIQMRCVLKEGNGNIMDNSSILPLKIGHNIALFQQLCLPVDVKYEQLEESRLPINQYIFTSILEEQVCPAPYTFERLPGHVLVGIAKEVLQAESVEKCLSMCSTAKKEIEIDCRSAMYYYDTGECILNDENRVTSATMISNDTLDMRVDYFENNCFDVQCSTDFTLHWIKVERFTMSDKFDIVIKQISKEECFKYCLDNKIDSQPFPCKLYGYSENEMTCHLTSESSLIYSTTNDDNQKISNDAGGYDYYEKICLKGSIRCQDSSFEHVSNHALLNIGNKVTTTSLTRCLENCLRSGKQCSSVMFFRDKDECILSKTNQYSTTEQLQYFSEINYFDNVCDYRIAINMSLNDKVNEMVIPTMNRQLNGTKNLWLNGTQFISFADNHDSLDINDHENFNLEAIHERLEAECGATGILISVLFSKPTVGAIFLKDHFATCRSEFSNAINATMEIALSTLRQDIPLCPGFEINPSIWSFIVVVQKNGLRIPGLMTEKDRVFNITCDYSNGQTTNDSTQDRILLQEASQDWLSIPTSNDHVRLTVLRDNQPVSTAVMGEELEMRWTLVQESMDNLGLFVNRCIAERLDGTPPPPIPLTLIANGCIDSKVSRLLMQHPIVQFDGGLKTKIKVFRFDGSRRVRILCSVDICIEKCLPVTCDHEINGSSTNPYKKKRETFTSTAKQTSIQRIRRELITGTFTIVEENTDMEANENVTEIGRQSLNQNIVPFQFPESNQLCIQTFAFFILIAFTVILLTLHIFMLCKYTRFRTQRSVFPDSERSCSIVSAPQRVYFGHKECYCPAEVRTTLFKTIRIQNEETSSKGGILIT